MTRIQRTLIRFELLQLARDRRTVVVAVVAPLLLLPGLLLVNRITDEGDEGRRVETRYRWTSVGPGAPTVDRWMERALAVPDSMGDGQPLLLDRVDVDDAEAALENRDIQLVVSDAGRDSTGVPVVALRFRASWDLSSTAATRVAGRLAVARTALRDSLYRAGGLPVDPGRILPLEAENVASAGREAGSFLGMILTPILVMLMVTGGSIVAADTLSGEKERGTLETLLTTAVSRRDIISAKGLAIVGVGLVVAIINIANLAVYVGLGIVELPQAMAISVTPTGLALLLLLLLPVALLIAAALLLVSGLSHSYREYQLWFFPAFLILLAPSAAAFLPGLELGSAVILVPVANVALAVRDVLAGRPDILLVLFASAITAVAAASLGVLAERTLSTERLLADREADRAGLLGGETLFRYRVLRWFGLMWVALLGASVWGGEALGMRGQILLNVVGIFLGGSLLMLWRYRLPARQVLALRPVHPLVWPAVLVGAPSAFLVGVGLATLTGRFIPVPPRVVEAFGQYLLPEGVGIVQLVLFLAVIPGICEEIAFRGVLLHGLRRRLGPVALCLAVGGIFGLFHVSLYRIVPTAYLGTVLAAVVVLTGSLLPAMLWHILNNAVILVPMALGWVGPEAGVPPWAYAAAAGGLVASMLVLHRVGRGYPGVTAPG
jgi:membrane protease YdiL (CAAX protease family)